MAGLALGVVATLHAGVVVGIGRARVARAVRLGRAADLAAVAAELVPDAGRANSGLITKHPRRTDVRGLTGLVGIHPRTLLTPLSLPIERQRPRAGLKKLRRLRVRQVKPLIEQRRGADSNALVDIHKARIRCKYDKL